MPKARKRAKPITGQVRNSNTSVSSSKTKGTIRRFHELLKRQAQLSEQTTSAGTLSTQNQAALADVQREIEQLGGLSEYQNMSAIGQSGDRGGGSGQVLVKWLVEVDQDIRQKKLSLLEVGALKPDNYAKFPWLDVTPIDLNARHPRILQQDFLQMELSKNRGIWDILSLSLVVNFVPKADDRGRMLKLAYEMLAMGGYLFLVVFSLTFIASPALRVEFSIHDGRPSVWYHEITWVHPHSSTAEGREKDGVLVIPEVDPTSTPRGTARDLLREENSATDGPPK